MSMPHHFPSLVDGPVQVVLVAGAGLSVGNAPTVDDDFKNQLTAVANSQGVSVAVDRKSDDYFYSLAEAVLGKQMNGDGKSESESRLWLYVLGWAKNQQDASATPSVKKMVLLAPGFHPLKPDLMFAS